MWVITRYTEKSIKIFEFDTEKEAREALSEMHGYSILTEVIFYNNPCLAI
ncbi:hypothetical protein [Bacillus sp. X1(2014)]|nr:hypothetical protein [Bacillus sp. X1(2014)]